MLAYLVKELRLGTNRNTPRLWLGGKYLNKAGFSAGKRYDIAVNDTKLQLTVKDNGTRIVSFKQKESEKLPIIDINSKELLNIFEGLQNLRIILKAGKIYIMPLAREVRMKERLARLREKMHTAATLTVGSICHGGGILSRAIHEGLASQGIKSECGFAVEMREELLSHSESANPFWTEKTQFISAPLQEIAFDEWAANRINKVDILEMALACSGASPAGRSKNNISMPEEHPTVGHLLVGALAIIAKANPAVICCENVVEYSRSASAAIIRTQLRDLGYRVEERILNGMDFNELEDRTRWCLLAVTEGMEFSFEELMLPERRTRHLSEILEDMPDDDPRWSAFQYLKDKQEKDMASGKGFRLQIFRPEDTRIATITKGYPKIRSTDPKIAHPSNPDLMRQLTVAEHARSKGIPEDLTADLCQTTAHEMLGQSVCFSPFVAVGRMIAQIVKRFSEHQTSTPSTDSGNSIYGCAA